MANLKVTILGCGTSLGVPVIGCSCAVCLSPHPRNKRYRTSLLLTLPSGSHVVFDTGPEFRLQMLRHDIKKLEHVIYTHLHADHCNGFDDLRAFYFANQKPIKLYMDPSHLSDFRSRFAYAFEDTGYLNTKGEYLLEPIPTSGLLTIDGVTLESIFLPHGGAMTRAFRIGSFAYATDFKYFPEDALAQWRGKIHTMVASGLKFGEHKTHSTIDETLALFVNLQVKRGIITHMSHEVEYEKHSQAMPAGVELAYDGLQFEHPLDLS